MGWFKNRLLARNKLGEKGAFFCCLLVVADLGMDNIFALT